MLPTQEEIISNFQEKIMARKAADITWIETISEYCSENEIDTEDIVKILSPWLISRIREESVALKLVRGEEKSQYAL